MEPSRIIVIWDVEDEISCIIELREFFHSVHYRVLLDGECEPGLVHVVMDGLQ